MIKQNGYLIGKLIITHLCMAIFGIMVTIPFSTENITTRTFCLVLGIVSVLLYAYLVYIDVWEIGAKDGIDVSVGKQKSMPFKGMIIALVAAIPDILLCGAYIILWYFRSYSEALAQSYIIVSLTTSLWEGAFIGIKSAVFGETFAYYFAIVPFFPVLIAEIAYLFGTKDKLCLAKHKSKK